MQASVVPVQVDHAQVECQKKPPVPIKLEEEDPLPIKLAIEGPEPVT